MTTRASAARRHAPASAGAARNTGRRKRTEAQPSASAAEHDAPASDRTAQDAGDHVELELKLAISAQHARRIARLPLIRSSTSGRTVTRSMHSVYYDTPQHDLQRAQAALRLRREGARWMQTLKFGAEVEGGLHRRHEVETRVAAQLIDHQVLGHPALPTLFHDAALRASLSPVFVADFRRTTRLLSPTPGTLIELCVDIGALQVGERQAPICEIELELKSGEPIALLDFADALVHEVPARLEPASKAERGYTLAQARTPAPVKATAPALDAGMTLEEAFRTIVFGCVQQLQANEAGVIGGQDSEYLHQARVALRRLRSAITVFDAAFPKAGYAAVLEELRWLGGCLGPARDWDVFVLSTLPQLLRAFPDEAGLKIIEQHAERLRAQTGAIAREALGSTRYTRLLLALIGLFYRRPWLLPADAQAETLRALPLPQFAEQMLARRQRKVVKRGRHHAQLDHAALHVLRIEVKKLRYAAEFMSTLYERKARTAYLEALARLQELLGGLNDAATVERLCHALRASTAGEPAGEAMGLLRGWAAALAQDHLRGLPRAWKRFRDARPFW